jgi:uncharacterized protein
MSIQIFVNLPVTDLQKSMDFYTQIGFTNNPQFTDPTAACMVLTEEIAVMLLTHEKFNQFTTKTIIDAKKYVGVINCLSVGSLEKMNTIVNAALQAGGIERSHLYGQQQLSTTIKTKCRIFYIIFVANFGGFGRIEADFLNPPESATQIIPPFCLKRSIVRRKLWQYSPD